MRKEKARLMLEASQALDQAVNLLMAAAELDNTATDAPVIRDLAHHIQRHNGELERRLTRHMMGER